MPGNPAGTLVTMAPVDQSLGLAMVATCGAPPAPANRTRPSPCVSPNRTPRSITVLPESPEGTAAPFTPARNGEAVVVLLQAANSMLRATSGRVRVSHAMIQSWGVESGFQDSDGPGHFTTYPGVAVK